METTPRSTTNRMATRTAPHASATWHNDDTLARHLQHVLSGEGEDDTTIEYFMRADLLTQRNVIATLAGLPIPINLKNLNFNHQIATRIDQQNIDLRAHWWGYQAIIPQSLLLKMDANSLNSRMEMILIHLMVIIPGQKMIVPYITALARMIADDYPLLMQIIKKSRQVAGVSISAIWLAPTTFVPSEFCNQVLG